MPRPLIGMLFAVAALSVHSQSVPAARISLPEPAYVGMPIWMQVESATNRLARYPSSTTPNDFYCNDVEVKRDGRLVLPLKDSRQGGNGAAFRRGRVGKGYGDFSLVERTEPSWRAPTLLDSS